jgi:hypothetical protein
LGALIAGYMLFSGSTPESPRARENPVDILKRDFSKAQKAGKSDAIDSLIVEAE